MRAATLTFLLFGASVSVAFGLYALMGNLELARFFFFLAGVFLLASVWLVIRRTVRFEVFVPRPTEDRAEETYLQWVHIGIRHKGPLGFFGADAAMGCRVRVVLNGAVHKMRWQAATGIEPLESRDIGPGEEELVPFLVESSRDGEIRYGVPLEKGVCYLTGENFLILHHGDVTVPHEPQTVRVLVYYNGSERMSKNVYVTFGHGEKTGRPIRIHTTAK